MALMSLRISSIDSSPLAHLRGHRWHQVIGSVSIVDTDLAPSSILESVRSIARHLLAQLGDIYAIEGSRTHHQQIALPPFL